MANDEVDALDALEKEAKEYDKVGDMRLSGLRANADRMLK